MNPDRPSEPPEEPYQTSEVALLSPASPKPIHFPTPTNIPVLEMQTDVEFNQTEAHMSDPAMHNTEVRPDFWRAPNEQLEEADHASPFSTGGGDAADVADEEGATNESDIPGSDANEATDNTESFASGNTDTVSVQLSNELSHQANVGLEAASASHAYPYQSDALEPASDPSAPSLDPVALSDQANAAASDQALPAAPAFNGNVDVQALLDTLKVPPSATAHTSNGVTSVTPSSQVQPSASGLDASSPSAASLGVAPTGLPPRPPPQEQPLIHPNYVHSQHIRDYHPHAANPAFQPNQQPGGPGNVADPTSRSFVPPVHSPTNPSSASAQQGLSVFTPLSATSQQPHSAQSAFQTPISAQSYTGAGYPGMSPTTTTTPIQSRREAKLAAGEVPGVEDKPWDAETQVKYDRFIETERQYVSEGRWDQFPMGSRLFVGTRNLDGTKTRRDEVTLVDTDGDDGSTVAGARADGLIGNLSSEKVTKRDIFYVFHNYGDLAQISIKQAYGFVQFLSADECKRALDVEQGRQIRDKRIHLEISKPQKSRAQPNQGRRSRSPDFGRVGKPAPGVDRYTSGRGGGGGGGGGGGYSKGPGYRSPSPPRGYRDRYNDRYRERSPDYGRRGGGRYRSPSPRRNEDDDLPLPRRAPSEVPDVQIIVLDTLDRDFITWVEKAFLARGVRVDVLLLSPRLSEQAVIRRQIVEGVVAVSKLTKHNQNSGKIGLQIFNRQGGQGNVTFEEYDNLDPAICVELVLRAKQQSQPTPAYGGGYGGAQYGAQSMPPAQQQQQYGGGYGQAYGQQPAAAPTGWPPAAAPYPPQTQQQPPPQNLQNLITNLDPNGLQSLLSAMNPQQSPNTPQIAAYGTPQSAGYPQHQHQHQQQQHAAMAALQQNPQMAQAMMQQAQHQQSGTSGGGQVNMQDILAKLGTYKQ
ncbi:hypothetical protein BAUCODRAFT_145295 [Baudoinia panamericana UAMH 10762]|uniref:RRM domain-containing protein n=1 Tax=Baudoinia panamericana (strain UAMH 10762) TaxID=717646 RepID=M2NKK1_BAUPA|nr:uncharacterized protein BAUCODRAFT_145295 [Baudoinia panamericana UAMH 10762]EMC99964.1 hypothetical protein BAUCODRAFT_145295 [Baudoinia panamericana UAMH 10762]